MSCAGGFVGCVSFIEFAHLPARRLLDPWQSDDRVALARRRCPDRRRPLGSGGAMMDAGIASSSGFAVDVVERPALSAKVLERRARDTVVLIRGFELPVVIGVSADERRAARTLRLDLDIGLASALACASDAIADTVDYGGVVRRLREEVAGKSYRLLERLADELAAVVLADFDAAWVRLSALKFAMFDDVESTGVEVFRSSRGDLGLQP
jgi:dihydroneopterin aldolase